jgi:hypothetical protein
MECLGLDSTLQRLLFNLTSLLYLMTFDDTWIVWPPDMQALVGVVFVAAILMQSTQQL